MTSSANSPTFPETQANLELSNTLRLLSRLGRERFYGKLSINFEAGKIVTLRKEETLKPNELGR